MIEKYDNENQFDFMKRIVYSRLVDKTNDTPYEELSEALFGEGNCYNESEVRKRMYGMLRLFDVMETEKNENYNRILTLSDFHFPFQLPIQKFEKYRGAVDVLVLSGDLIDFVQISKFKKVCRNTPMEDVVGLRSYLIDLIKYIDPKEVIVNDGNHEKRFETYLQKNMENDLLELVPSSILEYIFEDGFYHYDRKLHTKTWYDSLNKVFPDKKITYSHSWFCQIGDTIFAHPIAFVSGLLKTCDRAVKWFNDNQYSFKQLILSHTHHSGEGTIGRTEAIEQGCCCDTESNNYNDGRLTSPQQEGYVYICQDKNGNTDKNMTDRVILN